MEHECPKRDAGVHTAGKIHVADRATVNATGIGLELGDDLHRPDLGRSRHGTRREAGPKRIQAGKFIAEITFYV